MSKDVSSSSCDDGYFIAQAKYSIIKLEGTKLYVGVETSGPIGTSPENRLQELAKSPFVEQ